MKKKHDKIALRILAIITILTLILFVTEEILKRL